MDRYLVISADTHAGPPTQRYRDTSTRSTGRRSTPTWRPRASSSGAQGTVDPRLEEEWEAETGDGGRQRRGTRRPRNAELDREGVAGEVIFPDADVLGAVRRPPSGPDWALRATSTANW